MKKFSSIMLAMVFTVSMVGCGKTLSELRTDGDTVVDNGKAFVDRTTETVATILKKVISVGFAVYDLGKKVVDDTKDNVGTATGGLVGTTEKK